MTTTTHDDGIDRRGCIECGGRGQTYRAGDLYCPICGAHPTDPPEAPARPEWIRTDWISDPNHPSHGRND